MQLCARSSISFRAKQCAEYNAIPRNGKKHKWKPYEPTGKSGDNTCVLYCINEERVYSKLSPRAKDGTPCKRGTNNMCVSGACRVKKDFVSSVLIFFNYKFLFN